jgi:hypothetical protein
VAPHAIAPIIEILFLAVCELCVAQIRLRFENEDVTDILASAAIIAGVKVAVHVPGEADGGHPVAAILVLGEEVLVEGVAGHVSNLDVSLAGSVQL